MGRLVIARTRARVVEVWSFHGSVPGDAREDDAGQRQHIPAREQAAHLQRLVLGPAADRGLIVADVERSQDPTRVLSRAPFEQSRLAHRRGAHHHRVSAQPDQRVDVLPRCARRPRPAPSRPFAGPSARSLRGCRRLPRAPSRSTTWIRSAPASAKLVGHVRGIVRVDGRMRVVAAHESHAAAAQDVDRGDDEHCAYRAPTPAVRAVGTLSGSW